MSTLGMAINEIKMNAYPLTAGRQACERDYTKIDHRHLLNTFLETRLCLTLELIQQQDMTVN